MVLFAQLATVEVERPEISGLFKGLRQASGLNVAESYVCKRQLLHIVIIQRNYQLIYRRLCGLIFAEAQLLGHGPMPNTHLILR